MTQSEQRHWFVGLLPAVSKGVGVIVLVAGCLSGCSNSSTDKQSNHSLRNVYPGSDIQAILDAVSKTRVYCWPAVCLLLSGQEAVAGWWSFL